MPNTSPGHDPRSDAFRGKKRRRSRSRNRRPVLALPHELARRLRPDRLIVEVEQVHQIADGGRIDRNIRARPGEGVGQIVPAPLGDRVRPQFASMNLSVET